MTQSVRNGEELDITKVKTFLDNRLNDIPKDEPLKVEQYYAGASNLTYLLSCGEWQGVLRRPPFGPLPPKAHDMKREYEILSRLNPVFPLAPKPYVLGENTSVMDATFYVMERKEGVVIDGKLPKGVQETKELGRDLSFKFIDALAALHRVDTEQAGLHQFGKPEGFMERQVYGWLKRYERAKTEDSPEYENLKKWLTENIPADGETTVIHNDFKFNNLLFSNDLSEIKAVVDWEMATIGDPLFDLGVVLSYWIQDDDPELLQSTFQTVTTKPGFLTRRELIDRYAEKSGRDCSSIHFYLIFSYFKLAVISQQIYFRWKNGQTQDERFKHFGDRTSKLITFSWHLLNEK
ncbi:phosphotransferase family protein [Salicibibacter halophilus]|uniref:Phosphotransferase family protein n=1 Tax=Salicibibacter halophilus TaxID=2502791 RepID=A0A514LF66_9BACI|nr:phosphotransferase family protein [Salicibibacter halophilus]QDI90496.1 phosphotransferase family protein [Salicibibacter halophilus]